MGVQQLVPVVMLPDESTSPAGGLVPAPTGLPFVGDSGHSGNRRAPLGLRLVFTTARTSPRFATRASGWLRTSAAFAAGDFDGTGIKAPSRRGSRSFIRVAHPGTRPRGSTHGQQSRNRARKAGNHFASFNAGTARTMLIVVLYRRALSEPSIRYVERRRGGAVVINPIKAGFEQHPLVVNFDRPVSDRA